MRVRPAGLLVLAWLAGCAVPPPEAYTTLGGTGRTAESVDLGTNQVGETCVQSTGGGTSATIYCGAWQQPSGRVRSAGALAGGSLAGLATSGPWRTALDAAYICGAPQPAALDGAEALRLDCTRRSGGWPHVALVAQSGGQAWLADGVVPALPALARSIAILSGRQRGTIVTSAALAALQAQRRGGQARTSGDVREYDTLMLQGARANLADNPAAAESAYGAALALAEKAFGRDSPNAADPAMHLALQLSNQGRNAEAEALFTRSDALVARTHDDPTQQPRLLHYEALHAYNKQRKEDALGLLRQADAGYLAAIPPGTLRPQAGRPQSARSRSSFEASLDEALATPLQVQGRAAVAGLVEVRRYQGVVLRDLGRVAESDAVLASAAEIARGAGLDRPALTARLNRTRGLNAAQAGEVALALTALSDSNSAFSRAFPGSRPQAFTLLLEARARVQAGQAEAAIKACRDAVAVLATIRSGFEAGPMSPCLDAFATVAAKDPGNRQALLRDMFRVSQLVQGSTTSHQIQQASARLASGTGNPQIAEAIREQQDASIRLTEIARRRQALAEAAPNGQPPAAQTRALDEEERTARETLASRESALQAAAPNYDQLIQQATSAEDVLRTLRPGEAFASVTLTPEGGWTFLLRDGAIAVGRVRGGSTAIDPLVARIRAAMEPTLPAFDMQAAQAVYQAVFGELGGGLEGVKALTVAPSGSLLSLPFGVLLTGPGGAGGSAPWLVRQMAVGHVPSAGNFVALRRVSGGSRAQRPWFGFGDFRPVTAAQASRSFPAACGDSARLLARLPPLPSAIQELEIARKLLGGGGGDELLGPAFTAAAVKAQPLQDYRVLHFATHAILPSELQCQSEPALVTSAPRGAADASGALLTASDLAQVKLDADLVILSACNSGGPDGSLGGGESLSTLSRSFFFAGARALMITHWEVSDSAATFLVADTLRRLRAEPGLGVATALQQAQTGMLERAGAGLPAEFSHPFFWAPFALVGQAGVPAGAGL